MLFFWLLHDYVGAALVVKARCGRGVEREATS
jgi:hypothetical protein